MPKQVQVKIDTYGLDTGPFTITNNAGETIATGVTKIALANGITYTMADTASEVTITSTGTCTNSIVVPIVYLPPTPSPTITPTIEPTVTPTVQPTVSTSSAPFILTLSWIRSAYRFAASLNTPIGADITNMSIYVDGFGSPGCANSAIASASDIRDFIILPAGSTGYNWSPQTICGSISGNNSCWASASHYTIYNVNLNGQTVQNGGTVMIGGIPVVVNFPPCRQGF